MEAADNPKKLWQSTRSLLHTDDNRCEWNDNECDKLSTEFCKYFSDKILRIHGIISSALLAVSQTVCDDRLFAGDYWTLLEPTTALEVSKLLANMPAKPSPLDIIPTSLLKCCVDVFAPAISTLANTVLH